jgi:ABC-type transport system involved in multi-copper enzyme maturation permease subunit
MVKALLWKEWRRLRALRWSLVGIGLALPVLFAMAAKVAQRGWAFQAFTGYSTESLLLEAVPGALALGLWPLAAVVLAVQAFTADRADGTQAFLLDRPVRRAGSGRTPARPLWRPSPSSS